MTQHTAPFHFKSLFCAKSWYHSQQLTQIWHVYPCIQTVLDMCASHVLCSSDCRALALALARAYIALKLCQVLKNSSRYSRVLLTILRVLPNIGFEYLFTCIGADRSTQRAGAFRSVPVQNSNCILIVIQNILK